MGVGSGKRGEGDGVSGEWSQVNNFGEPVFMVLKW